MRRSHRGSTWQVVPAGGLLVMALAAPVLAGAPALVAGGAQPTPTSDASSGLSRAVFGGSGFAEAGWGDDTTKEAQKAAALTGDWQAEKDLGSLYSLERRTGAQQAWKTDDKKVRDGKVTGAGIGIALLDTGISPVLGLNAPGKVVRGPDLSLDSQIPGTRTIDGFGHGTHMAGIIAGRDPVKNGDEDKREHLAGVAPGATLIDVKIGAADGAADVSQVIAGIDWVVANKDTHGIRVLNLSYGTHSTQPYVLDPLAHAVENAWRAGIVVVVSAGNDGEDASSTTPVPLTMPAADPLVLAVGAVDHRGTSNADDDTVAAFTNPGTTRRPDLLAPGKSVVSLRAPGSNADTQHPEGLVTGDDSARLFRGSGTSQAAAVVSGAAALLLQADPTLTPDQVKGLLVAGADRLKRDDDPAQGAGTLNIQDSLDLTIKAGKQGRLADYAPTTSYPPSTGLGSLDAARGGSHLIDPQTGMPLTGEIDIFGAPWDRRTWSQASAARRTWSGEEWNGSSWNTGEWTRRTWSGSDWTRRTWSGDDFQRRTWSAADFQRRTWSGTDFQRRTWSASGWTGTD